VCSYIGTDYEQCLGNTLHEEANVDVEAITTEIDDAILLKYNTLSPLCFSSVPLTHCSTYWYVCVSTAARRTQDMELQLLVELHTFVTENDELWQQNIATWLYWCSVLSWTLTHLVLTQVLLYVSVVFLSLVHNSKDFCN